MHNVELKAELRDIALARAICRSIGASFILDFDQTDTYYRIPHGRLKRRETQGEPVEVVFYERPNRASPKLSQFTIFTEEQATERFGREPLPVWMIVRKHRELWMQGAVRIHLDTVARLGTFLEFEALVSKGNNLAQAHDAIASLRTHFRPAMGELIDCSYSDLLERDNDGHVPAGPPLLPPA
jgi:adenylate cyclase class IV